MLWRKQAGMGWEVMLALVVENTHQVGLEPLLWTAGTGERGSHLAIRSDLDFC